MDGQSRSSMLKLKWSLFFLLIAKPLAIVILAIGLTPSPRITPSESTPMERKELHSQWVEKLFKQHHKLTDLKLIYTRLPLKKKNQFNRALNEIHRLYQTAVETLKKLEMAEGQQWQVLAPGLLKISHQIDQTQEQLEANLTLYAPTWVYQI